MLVFTRSPPIPQKTDALRDRILVGNHGAPLPVCAKVLSGVEAEASRLAEAAHASTAVACPVGLTGVFHHLEPAGICDCQHLVQGGRVAVEMNGDDGLRSWCDRRLELRW